VTRRVLFLTLAAIACVALPGVAAAQTYRFVAPDGTVHYTNAPRDPSYQRMGFTVRAVDVAPRPIVTYSGDSYVRVIHDRASRYGVPERLVTAVIRAESGFNPRAVSPKGARGLMQLMPQTASLLGVRDSFDPEENIDGGVRHLRGLIERFGHNLSLALAAYNAGEQAVTYYRGIPPYPETQGYVQKVLWLFNGGNAAAAPVRAPIAYPTYRFTDDDGTVVYSNLPPRAAARLVRR
jgi:transglycosylase-like protein with SLT domain/uncharacterized protein DUF4124